MIRFQQHCRRRGSVFLLVVAILAVLGLLTITLSYSARVELYASRNSVDAVQARLAVLTGVPFASPGTPPTIFVSGATAASGPSGSSASSSSPASARGMNLRTDEKAPVPLNLLIDRKSLAGGASATLLPGDDAAPASGGLGAVSARQAIDGGLGGLPGHASAGDDAADTENLAVLRTSLGESVIEDESAKLNINAILPSASTRAPTVTDLTSLLTDPKRPGPAGALDADQFALFIEETLKAKAIAAPASPKELADAIILHRYGRDQLPGAANVDDNGNAPSSNPASDGIDNDHDGIVDNPEEETLSPDSDGLDNNRNGVIDEPGESIITDGLDNDGNGEIDNADEATDEPAEFSADIRLRPRGDDQPFASLWDLMAVPGMTTEVFGALSPHLTCFSVSQPAYPDPEDIEGVMGIRQIDPNTAGVKDIYEALRRRYPNLPVDLVGQFSVNIVDRRDTDDIPTVARLGSSSVEYVGFELTPRINEVFPYTGGGDSDAGGDDGQFVEIINPYTKTVNLSGWRLEGGGMTVWLRESLPAESFLVITDDYNDAQDSSPEDEPGRGSLYALFGAVPSGPKAQIRIEPLFSLSDDIGAVSLYNREGILVDSFRYKEGRHAGSLRRSFQRADPRAQKESYGRDDAQTATPFKMNRGAHELSTEDREILRTIEKLQNQPYRSPLELMLVLTNYKPTSASTQASSSDEEQVEPDSSATAQSKTQNDQLRLPSMSREVSDNIGSSVVDIFMPGVEPRRNIQLIQAAIQNPNAAEPLPVSSLELKLKAMLSEPPALHGRININTAPTAVIAALPGVTPELAHKIAALREIWLYGIPAGDPAGRPTERFEPYTDDWFKALPPQDTARWRSLSDLLGDNDLWGEDADLLDRIQALYPFSRVVAFHSLSYHVVTRNIPTPNDANETREQTFMLSDRIVAGDRGRPETISFRYLGASGNAADKDVEFGVEAGEAEDLSLGLLRSLPKNRSLPVYEGPALLPRPKRSQESARRAAASINAETEYSSD